MTIQDFLLKYGTRMAPAILKQKDEEMAKDLQAAFEHYINYKDIHLSKMSLQEAIRSVGE